jgi:hypothetical protein
MDSLPPEMAERIAPLLKAGDPRSLLAVLKDLRGKLDVFIEKMERSLGEKEEGR